MKKVVLAGGSGYIGSVLADFYSEKAEEVVILSRGRQMTRGNIHFVSWDGKTKGDWVKELDGADLLVNLTGKNVNCRYTKKNKDEILNSRLDSTMVLGEAIRTLSQPPEVWIQCASATIYRHSEDRSMDETSGEFGDGFSVDVCRAWEKSFQDQPTPRTRKIVLRTSIVLGKSGGAFPRLINMVRAGIGGKQGSGKQRVSWIHEEDVCRVIDWLFNNETAASTFNCTSPDPVTNHVFMKVIRDVVHVPFGLATPAWLLTLGAWLIGTETELILKSRWVIPSNLLQAGYTFRYPTLKSAIQNILSK